MKSKAIITLLFCVISITDAYCSGIGHGDEMSERQNQVLERLYKDPYPRESNIWFNENYATSMFALNKDLPKANMLIEEICDKFYPKLDKSLQKGSFHWQAYILERLYLLFSSKSNFYANRMSKEVEKKIENVLWDWTSYNCTADLTIPEHAVWIWGSENHHLQAWVSFWGAMQILKDVPEFQNRKYKDGSTPIQLAKGFDEYLKYYFRNRAKHGLMIEIASPGYSKYSLNTIYNIADFAQDKVLKRLVDNFLNVYWTEWAIEQIDGIRGGSRHRCYPGRSSIQESGSNIFAWYHFGIGSSVASPHPGNNSIMTTLWRPDTIIYNLVKNHTSNGSYAYISRNYGLKSDEAKTSYFGEKNEVYKFAIDKGGLLRYTWVNPTFVMGMTMENAYSQDTWTAVSSQNRWNGIIFKGNNTKRIFTQPEKPQMGSVYNAEWGVQDKGVMILQRMVGKTNEGKERSNAQGQAIWIEKTLLPLEYKGWLFIDSSKDYAAIKVIKGSVVKVKAEDYGKGIKDSGFWLKLTDESSPIIFEVAQKSDFKDFDDFKESILRNPLMVDNNSITYDSKYYNNSLKLFYDYSELPKVNRKTINLFPQKLMSSPYLNSIYDSGIITISDGKNSKTLDFNF